MANYFDSSHIDGKQLTPQQIADAIRHKKFGVDVREAMAQGLEYMLSWWELVQKLDKDFDTLSTKHKEDVKQLQKDKDGIDARLKKLEDAVFNAIYINDTDENATESNTGVTRVDINDSHVVDDDNGIILEEDNPTLPRDLN